MELGIEVWFSMPDKLDHFHWVMLHPPSVGDKIIYDGNWVVVSVRWGTANLVGIELLPL